VQCSPLAHVPLFVVVLPIFEGARTASIFSALGMRVAGTRRAFGHSGTARNTEIGSLRLVLKAFSVVRAGKLANHGARRAWLDVPVLLLS
jgi:hypothetical protein